MKNVNKFASILLALVMVFCLTATAFAADAETYTITAPDNGHTYEVYQIFTGDLNEGVLSNVKWGKNGTGTTGEAVADTILKELEATTGSNSEKLAVITQYVNLSSEKFGIATSTDPLTDVPAGYYLIKDVDGSQAGKDDVYTLFIVEVVDDVTIRPKSDKPSSSKSVQDVNDTTGETSGWQDSADYDIGDKVPFLLTGKVASDYDSYAVYKFTFHDTESDGLSFDASTVSVSVDGVEISSGFAVVTNPDDGHTFDIVFADLKTIESVHAGSVITVEYKSTLNDSAAIGSTGNPNTMHLEYSNNPNDKQGVETGKTPDDTVIVFTYKTIINKVTPDGKDESGNDKTKPLAGAAFRLEKQIKGTNEEESTWTVVKEFTVDQQNPATSFEFTGLDDGTYMLTETVTPKGYNTIEPIVFTITATHSTTLTDLSGNKVTGEIAFTMDASAGSLSADVINNAGSTLPETGGIGTTIFYTLGGILVLTAVVLLVTKKRMNTFVK